MSANVMRNPDSKSERGPASRSIDTSPSSLPPLLRCDDLLRIRVVPISSPALGGANRLLFAFAPEASSQRRCCVAGAAPRRGLCVARASPRGLRRGRCADGPAPRAPRQPCRAARVDGRDARETRGRALRSGFLRTLGLSAARGCARSFRFCGSLGPPVTRGCDRPRRLPGALRPCETRGHARRRGCRRNGESLLDIQKRNGHLTARAPFRRERVSMRGRPHAFCIEIGLKRNRRHEHDHAIIITDVPSGPDRMRPRKTGRCEISPIAVTTVFITMHLQSARLRGVVGVVVLETTPRANASYSPIYTVWRGVVS